jgi:hypothetical protein
MRKGELVAGLKKHGHWDNGVKGSTTVTKGEFTKARKGLKKAVAPAKKAAPAKKVAPAPKKVAPKKVVPKKAAPAKKVAPKKAAPKKPTMTKVLMNYDMDVSSLIGDKVKDVKAKKLGFKNEKDKIKYMKAWRELGERRGRLNLTTVGNDKLGDGNAFHSIVRYKSGKKKGQARYTTQSHEQSEEEEKWERQQNKELAKKYDLPAMWDEVGYDEPIADHIRGKASDLRFDTIHDGMVSVMKGKAEGY